MDKTLYICTLSEEDQNRLRRDLEVELGLRGFGQDAIDRAMEGRLCDVEELIDLDSFSKGLLACTSFV